MSSDKEKFTTRDKTTFNLIFNSSIKRHIIGIYFLLLKRVIQNTNFNPISFNEFIKESGSKGIISQEYLKKAIENEQDYNTLDLLVSYKILQPIKPSTEAYDFLSLEEVIEVAEKFQFANGIEFEEKIYKTSSSEFAISLNSLNMIMNSWLERKIQQNKIQKAIDELHTVPSRVNPHYFHYFLTQVDSKNNPGFTKKRGNFYYSLTDAVVDFLNTFHPILRGESDNQDGEQFLNLIDLSIKLDSITKQSEKLSEKSKTLLKLLDSKVFHKSIIFLSEKIILRELIITSLTDLVTDKSRLPIFQNKLRTMSDQGIIAWQIVKEAEMTAKDLPKVFEHIQDLESPIGSTGDWMVAFSRLMISYLLNKAIKQSLGGADALFKSEIGTNIMVELFEWTRDSSNLEITEQIHDLLMEAKTLVEFYSEESIKDIAKNYLSSS
jgi:hypothetical protein